MKRSLSVYVEWIRVFSICIAAALFALFVYTYLFGSDTVLPIDVSPSKSVDSDVCDPVSVVVSDKTIILRVDDVQAFAWSETSELMITDAESRGIPLTLGVIPVGLEEDEKLVPFLRQHACNLEFALHGFDHGASIEHSGPEFGELDHNHAAERIAQGLQILKVLTDERVATWIPPQNRHSTGTAAALEDFSFTYISSEGKGKWDYNATMFDYGTDNLLSVDEMVAACDKRFETDNTCVVMIHPQNFADDLQHNQVLYDTYYLRLLDALVGQGYTFARFKDFTEIGR